MKKFCKHYRVILDIIMVILVLSLYKKMLSRWPTTKLQALYFWDFL